MNKIDIAPLTEEDRARIDAFCADHYFAGWYATSAKEGTNVGEAFRAAVNAMVELWTRGELPVAARASPHSVDLSSGRQPHAYSDGHPSITLSPPATKQRVRSSLCPTCLM